MHIKSDIDDLNIFLTTRSGELKLTKWIPSIYVSTEMTIPFFLSKKTSSFRLRAALFFLVILAKYLFINSNS